MQAPTFLSSRSSEERTRDFTVVIAYDNAAAGRRAAHLFSTVGKEHTDDLRFRLQPWRFDLLSDPDWGPFAAGEALEADLLVVSTSSPHLPAMIKDWLTVWLDAKRGAQAAVVALIDAEQEAASANSAGLEFLRSATNEAGLDFFSPQLEHGHPFNHFTPVPPQAFASRTPYRHWGINE